MTGTQILGTDAVMVADADAIPDPADTPDDMVSERSNDVIKDEELAEHRVTVAGVLRRQLRNPLRVRVTPVD